MPKCFEEITKVLTSDLSVAHFDPKLEIVATANESQSGPGAVIQHKYVNKKLNEYLMVQDP